MKKILVCLLAFCLFVSSAGLSALAAEGRYVVTAPDGAPLYLTANDSSTRFCVLRPGTVVDAERVSASGLFIRTSYEGFVGWLSLADVSAVGAAGTALRIASLPYKTQYYEEDAFDAEGLVVCLVSADGTERALSGYTLAVPNMDVEGVYPVVVTYRGLSASFDIRIDRIPIERVEITTPPHTTTVIEGSDAPDLSGMVVTAYFTDGREPRVLDRYTVSGYDPQTLGEQTLNIYYKYPEFGAALTVQVVERSVTNLVITQMPQKTVYYDDDPTLDLTGLVLTAYFNNGHDEVVEPESAAFQKELVPGETNTVVLTYGGRTASYSVGYLAAEPVALAVDAPDNLTCLVGSEPDFSSDIVVYLVYNSGRRVPVNTYTADRVDTSAFGQKTVNVYYETFSASFSVQVTSPYAKGDIDRNGKINSADARLALRYASRLMQLDSEQLWLGDVTGDGKLISADARRILRHAAKLELIDG